MKNPDLAPQNSPQTPANPILFFDGVCSLCNGFVDLLLRNDKKQLFRVASLQGETAKQLLNPKDISSLASFILFWNGKPHYRSTAALMVFRELGGLWSGLAVFSIVPPPIRDFVYNLIAKNRYRLFGRRDTCRIPQPHERKQFLP